MTETTVTQPPPDMSNFDGHIPDGLADYVKSGGQGAKHYGWNFCGDLYYRDGKYVEEVFRYHELVATITADNLEALRVEVNEQFGWD